MRTTDNFDHEPPRKAAGETRAANTAARNQTPRQPVRRPPVQVDNDSYDDDLQYDEETEEQEDQYDPKPPEGEYPNQQPSLPWSAHQSHDGDNSTDQNGDAAAQKSFVVTHFCCRPSFRFCLKTKKEGPHQVFQSILKT